MTDKTDHTERGELLPCPFCGGDAEDVGAGSIMHKTRGQGFFAECPISHISVGVTHWNCRALTAQSGVREGMLRAALDRLVKSQLSVIQRYEAGKAAQDAWADERASAIKDAEYALYITSAAEQINAEPLRHLNATEQRAIKRALIKSSAPNELLNKAKELAARVSAISHTRQDLREQLIYDAISYITEKIAEGQAPCYSEVETEVTHSTSALPTPADTGEEVGQDNHRVPTQPAPSAPDTVVVPREPTKEG